MDNSEKVVVVGSGIAGMCTALAMARKNMSVTVLERDSEPPEGDAEKAFFEWPRRGASQFRHPHAFLGLMCNLLQDNYPDLLEAFYAAGARRVDYREMLPAELEDKYEPAPGDEKLFVLMCRRATIETVMRRFVAGLPNITFVNNISIDGLVTEHTNTGLAVRGLKVRRDCVDVHGAEILGDIIVDASGRNTHFPRWLAAAGPSIIEENDNAEIIYYTRHYKFRPGFSEPSRHAEDRSSGDLGYIKYGVFPGDNASFAIIVCLHKVEKDLHEAIKYSDTFDAVCRSIPGLTPWLTPGQVDATTDSFGMADIRAVWRHYVVDGKPIAQNIFAVGDAAIRTNPLYGRGCSTGILHAHILADTVSEIQDPVARALAFSGRSEEAIRPIFEASLTEDKNGIRRSLASAEGRLHEKPKNFKQKFGLAFGDALMAAARYNLRVNRGFMRTVNLLEKPGEFLQDRRTRLIVMFYMLRGRSRNALARNQRGPTRDEMLSLTRQ
jgi:2-polyprenyl-6-methoxyphenol hydroxylase-like FAD-dependent oxidoreductase